MIMTIQEHKMKDNEVALLKSTIEKWIKENYECTGLKISNNPNKDGLYEVSAQTAEVKNKNITSLTNECFKWIKVGYFSCANCSLLTSLVGLPKEIGGDFDCSECKNLKSLVGAPKKVEGSFNCSYCDSLISLEDAPQEVGANFYCYDCKTKFTEDTVRKLSDVKIYIYC